MTLLMANDLAFRFPNQTENLFSNIQIKLKLGDRIGLVGQNGSGKSTLAQILAGLRKPLTGDLWLRPGLSVAFSAQQPGRGVLTLSEWFTRRGYDILSPAFIKAQHDWGINYERIFDPLAEWSGGEKTRAEVGAALHLSPDLLILDEPTNHLDREGLFLLATAMRNFSGALILISHNRRALDELTSTTWWLERGDLQTYAGAFSVAAAERQTHLAQRKSSRLKLEKDISALSTAQTRIRLAGEAMQTFRGKRAVKKNGAMMQRDEGSGSAQANPGKVMRQSKVMTNRLRRLKSELSTIHIQEEKQRRISFVDSHNHRANTLIWWDNQSIDIEGRRLLAGVRLHLKAGSRIALVGPNGCGKTLLLNKIVAELPTAGYLRQQFDIPSSEPVGVYLSQGSKDRLERGLLILGSLHVSGMTRTRPLSQLSLGERAKVELVKLILDEPELLILDEPTNHLSLIDLQALVTALQEFPGSIVAVSHDMGFLHNLGCTVLDLTAAISSGHPSLPGG